MAQSQEVTCSACSTTLRIPDKYWGKKIRCPQCKEVISVPAAAPLALPGAPGAAASEEVEFLDDDAFLDEGSEADGLRTAGAAAPRVAGAPPSKPDPKAKAGGGAFGMERKMVGSGILGGLALMVGAAVWFVLGLMADRIFFYPPIMFIIGFVALIKGLIGSR